MAAILLLCLLQEPITVERLQSTYRVADGQTSGEFKTGQRADLMLSGVDFNNTGGPLLFNHPGGIATDGKRLLLADRNNNRILIWTALPDGNVSPDLVLGQKDFTANDPGRELDRLNWPVAVATDGRRVVVADTYNDRILVWNSFPTENGQEADFALRSKIAWPWAVWTDGKKLIATNTAGACVLIWNSFPTSATDRPSIVLRGEFGTPRSIGCDGTRLIIGDHNARGKSPGNFFWKVLPTRGDTPYDFFLRDPVMHGGHHGEILWSPVRAAEDRWIALGGSLYVWDSFPTSESDLPDVRPRSLGPSDRGFYYEGGDGSGLALAGERLYVSLSNGNRIVGFRKLPSRPDARPDFAIGSPEVDTNPLRTHVFITNGVPFSNGKSLFVSSDFDRRLYVWSRIPDESGAKPDFIYTLPTGPWAGDIRGDTLILGGRDTVYLWKRLPTDGRLPDEVLRERIGKVRFQEIKGVALDDRRSYVSDEQANRVYVWKGLPNSEGEPEMTLEFRRPRRLSSDGRYLAVTSIDDPGGAVWIYDLEKLAPDSRPTKVRAHFNLPEHALVRDGRLFVADTVFSRVLVWNRVDDALQGAEPNVILGAKSLEDHIPEIGSDKLFWPGAVSFDGRHLWVGEFKFSGRLLRFSPTP